MSTDALREYLDHHHPQWDRAAGALMGAAAAVCLVGADPALSEHLLSGDATASHAGHLGWLLTTTLTHVETPAHLSEIVDCSAERPWAHALRRTVREATVPPVDGTVPHGPVASAWRAVLETPTPGLDPAGGLFPCGHLVEAVWAAHSSGGDEAAMYAGALAGARWGASGIPLEVLRRLGDTLPPRELVTRAVVAARGHDPDNWPEFPTLMTALQDPESYRPFRVPHPHDPGVELCNLAYMRQCADAEAVVSLSRIGLEDPPGHVPASDRLEVWLHDRPGANPNLHFVLDQAATAVAALRAEGKRVLLHCAACQSRTPAVAAHYAARARGADPIEALRTIITAVGGHLDNPELARAVAELNGRTLDDPAAALFPEGVAGIRR